MYQRILENFIEENIGKGKAIIIVGARQVGKTTLIKTLLEGQEFLFLDADGLLVQVLRHLRYQTKWDGRKVWMSWRQAFDTFYNVLS